MSVSASEAAAALKDVELTQARSAAASTYRHASPHLLLWGVVWMVGYGLTGVVEQGDLWKVWLAADGIGAIGSTILGVTARRDGKSTGSGVGLSALAVLAFMVAAYVVMKPTETAQYMVFPALLIALVYSLAGCWRLRRLLWIGAALFLLTMGGYLFLQPWLAFWMAAVGGGALILGGLWLRNA